MIFYLPHNTFSFSFTLKCGFLSLIPNAFTSLVFMSLGPNFFDNQRPILFLFSSLHKSHIFKALYAFYSFFYINLKYLELSFLASDQHEELV